MRDESSPSRSTRTHTLSTMATYPTGQPTEGMMWNAQGEYVRSPVPSDVVLPQPVNPRGGSADEDVAARLVQRAKESAQMNGTASGTAATSEAYEPRNILVTGGAGFIASHVVVRLMAKYPAYKVVVLDKLDYCASMNNLASARDNPNFKFVKGDIQSMDLVSFVCMSEHIDTIMHFAAETHVDNSFGNSLAFTMSNTYGTHVMLEAARMAGTIKRFINVSTDEVYGETSLGLHEGLPEHSALDPTNPYSAAKAGAEMMCKAYMTSYRLPIIITRGNNVYGPHQFPEKLIPKFILRAFRKQTLPMHGNGTSVRSYLYVDDVAEAFDTILHKGVTGETYNIGTERELKVKEVAQAIAEYFKLDPLKQIIEVDDRAFNDRRYYIGCDKLARLGWKESTSWEEGLKRTIEWYQKTRCEDYWKGDLALALEPHPVLSQSSLGNAATLRHS